MIEIWGRKNAYNVQKVLWTLHELQLEYSHHDVGSNPGDLETNTFLAMNPHARIPVISDKNVFIWESNTIIRYLAATYSNGNLWNSNPLQRTLAERWMDWELATLQADFIELFWSYYRTPEDKRDSSKIEAAKTRCESHFDQLEQQLTKHSYLAGEAFSMGDIPCATSLHRYFTMGLNVEQPTHVLAWYQRLKTREAFQNTMLLPYTELKGRAQF